MIFLNIFIIILILVFDFIWLIVNRNMYNTLVSDIQGSEIKLNFTGGIIAYTCIIISFFMFAFPLVRYEYEKNNKKQSLILLSLKYGGILGLVIYGIFNGTNIAIFTNYNYTIGLKDTLWGIFNYSIITYIYTKLYYSNISSIS
jgi:uncharacterized membrane protein